MTPIIVVILVLAVGLYFIWRGERKEKKGKVVKFRIDEIDLDEHESKIS